MKRLIVLVFGLAAIACFPSEIKRTYGDPVVEQREVSCSTSGYCYDCGMDWEGNMSCGFRMSLTCPGRQMASVSVRPLMIYYDDGTSRYFQDVSVIEKLSRCQ